MKKVIAMMALYGFFHSLNAFSQEVEPLLGLAVNEESIQLQVFSGGCTSKKSFRVVQLETNPVQIQFIRIRPDYCEAYFPYGISLKYSFEELGLEEGQLFQITNPNGLHRARRQR